MVQFLKRKGVSGWLSVRILQEGIDKEKLKYHRAEAANFALLILSQGLQGGVCCCFGCTCAGVSDGAFKDPSYLSPICCPPFEAAG